MHLKRTALALILALTGAGAFAQSKPVYPDAEAAKHVGEEATVTGKVFSVSTSGKGTTFLNFGGRFPNHVFGGVVFAKNAEAVGDLKSYEGKEVSLSGRIELSPDQKPQIVISRADQLALATAAAPATPPVAGAPPTPAGSPPMSAATTPAPSTPAPAKIAEPYASPPLSGKIELAANWNSPRRGGDMVRKDLAKLFGESGTAGETTRVDTAVDVYPGVPFLSPLAAAKRALNLEAASSRKIRIATPGFPQDSFSAHVFEGVYPGGFTRLHLVTDNGDQVVSLLLTDASPRVRVGNEPDTTGYHTYNFITGDGKAASYLSVRHQTTPPASPSGVIVVDTLLVDPNDPEAPSSGKAGKSSSRSGGAGKQKTGKVLERSRWFVPAPVVNLILRCVGG